MSESEEVPRKSDLERKKEGDETLYKCPFCAQAGENDPWFKETGVMAHIKNWCEHSSVSKMNQGNENTGEGGDETLEEEPPQGEDLETEIVCPECGNPDNGENPQHFVADAALKRAFQSEGKWTPEKDKWITEADQWCSNCGTFIKL